MRRNRGSEERQKNIFDFIKDFLMEKGYPPSVREIGKAVGLKSSSTVHGYLARLEEAGLIKRCIEAGLLECMQVFIARKHRQFEMLDKMLHAARIRNEMMHVEDRQIAALLAQIHARDLDLRPVDEGCMR